MLSGLDICIIIRYFTLEILLWIFQVTLQVIINIKRGIKSFQFLGCPALYWLNTDASRIEVKKATAISNVYKNPPMHQETNRRYSHTYGGNSALHTAMVTVCQMKQSNIMVKSDSYIAKNFITGKIKATSQIVNLVEHIINLPAGFKNVRFSFCNKRANQLADRIAKKAHKCNSQRIVLCD